MEKNEIAKKKFERSHIRDEKPSKKSTDAYVMKNNIEWVFLSRNTVTITA